jgi:hypothetical protein
MSTTPTTDLTPEEESRIAALPPDQHEQARAHYAHHRQLVRENPMIAAAYRLSHPAFFWSTGRR